MSPTGCNSLESRATTTVKYFDLLLEIFRRIISCFRGHSRDHLDICASDFRASPMVPPQRRNWCPSTAAPDLRRRLTCSFSAVLVGLGRGIEVHHPHAMSAILRTVSDAPHSPKFYRNIQQIMFFESFFNL